MASDGRDLRRMLEATGALRQGHFLLSSGRHSETYVQCALLLAQPTRAERVGADLAARIASLAPRSILSPALGGVIIGHEVARALDVPFRFAERVDGEMCLRRGFALAPGERVAVVEDVVTTGRSTRETVRLAKDSGAVVCGVAAILDRSDGDVAFGDVPFECLLRLSLSSYEPGVCPLCRCGQPIVKPGSRPFP